MKKIQSIEEMISILKKNPQVLGLVEYGNLHLEDNFATGDYDLFVVLKDNDLSVESLHFYTNDIPVDLNIRTLQEIGKLKCVHGFDQALLESRVIHDPTDKVLTELDKLKERQKSCPHQIMSEHAKALTRHGHKHVFDKIKGRLDSMPLFCEFLLGANMHWLVKTYFDVHELPFKGEKHALEYLNNNEQKIYQAIVDYYNAPDLSQRVEISKRLTEMILKPVSGSWRDDEVLAFGDNNVESLQDKGRKLYQQLFRGA